MAVGKTLNLTGRFERLDAAKIDQLTDNRFRTLTEVSDLKSEDR